DASSASGTHGDGRARALRPRPRHAALRRGVSALMKLVLTLVVRDEADIVDAQLAYHLNAGVDFVLATDHASTDGTLDVLHRYEREGHLRLFDVAGEMRESEW